MLSRGSMTHSAAHTQVELRVGRGAARQQSSRTTARQADRSAIKTTGTLSRPGSGAP